MNRIKSIAVALSMAFTGVFAVADTITVNPDGSGDYTTIGDAIAAANPGDVIEVAAGTYGGTVNVGKQLTIRGAGRGKTVIDANNARRCLAIPSGVNDVIVSDITFRRGVNSAYDGTGGGVNVDGGTGIRFVDCSFENCQSYKGSAIYSKTASGVAAIRCFFTGCESYSPYGSGSAAIEQVDAYYCVFTRTYTTASDQSSGNAPVCGPCTIVNCTVAGCGGLSYYIKGGVKAYNCIFARSSYQLADAATTEIRNCVTGIIESRINATHGEDSKIAQPDNHFVNMLADDYRLVEDSPAVGAGSAAALDEIPADYRYTDFNGNTVDPAGAVNAGCVAVGSVRPAGARVEIYPSAGYAGKIVVDGVTNAFDAVHFDATSIRTYFYAESWPLFHEIEFVGDENTIPWGLEASGADEVYRYPESDGAFVFMPPQYESGRYLRLDLKAAASVLHVDDDSTAETPDGTVGNEYCKIQDAVDAVGNGAFAIIRIAAGTYDQGGKAYSSVSGVPVIMSRINVANKKIRFIGAGADSTFVVGEPDPNAAAGNYGCGSGATRCFSADCPTSLENLTLTGGHTALGNSYIDCYGGAVSAGDDAGRARIRVSDCVISNNYASAAPVADATYGGGRIILSRCRILGNHAVRSVCWAKSIVSQSSLWAFNETLSTSGSRDASVWGANGSAWVFDSTWYAVADETNFQGWMMGTDEDSSVVRNTVCMGAGLFAYHCADGCAIDMTIPYVAGSTVRKTTYTPGLSGDYAAAVGIAKFADPDDGDFRVKGTSSAVGLAFYNPTNDQTATYNAYAYATKSLDGVYPDFSANGGKFTAGAYRQPVPVVTVEAGSSILPQLTDEIVEPGDELVFTFAATRKHPSKIAINGVVQPGSGTGCTFTVPEGFASALVVTEVPDTDIYVSKDGDDGNPGTADLPKLTLKGGLENAVAGDTVHVGPGDYDTLTMTWTSGGTPVRAWVKTGVRLVSEKGAAETRIIGEPSTAEGNNGGCGPGAVRCVKADANSEIRGFTITGGRVDYNVAQDAFYNVEAKDYGANVLADSGQTAKIFDCVISEGRALMGGGMHYGRYYRCRILNNTSLGSGNPSAARMACFYGCFVDGNMGLVTDLMTDCQQCTFGPNGGNTSGDLYRYGGSSVANTIFSHGLKYNNTTGTTLSNCIFRAGATFGPAYEGRTCTDVGCRFDVPASELQFAEDGITPIIGSNAAVDKGVTEALLPELGDVDLCGNARVQNANKVDVGAVEADWRKVYARKLGSKVTVSAASPAVELTEDGILLPAGATLAASMSPVAGLNCHFDAAVSDGTLAVGKDGEAWKELDSSSPVRQDFVAEDETVLLDFAMGDEGSAVLSRFRRDIGFQILVR